ncbi:potassium channel family protein [Mesorhizobium sp. CAU 1741]|uniref:potassium channel family protein n=1 Tax=Mesorhizobium sp. CAU 1741 TaxID=3140366 RepID=UPI00325AD0C8
MLHNLAFGTGMIAATVVVHMVGLMMVTSLTQRVTRGLGLERRHAHMLAMVLVALGIFAVLGVEIWMWVGAYLALGLFPDLDTALYFSITTFCTLGYGDVVPPAEWRVFAALEGVNGFLMIGWSTAYLIAAGIRIGPFKPGEHF